LVRELARALARDGFDIDIITTDTLAGHDLDGVVRVHRLAHRLGERLPGVLGVFALLFRMFWAGVWRPRPALIITLTDPPFLGVVGWMLAAIKRARHIHWVHDLYPDLLPVIGVRVPRPLYQALYRLSRGVMNKADRVIVTGRCMARYITQNGVHTNRVTMIPNWPELAMSPHSARAAQAASLPAIDQGLAEAVANASILGPVPKFRVLYVGTVGYAQPIDTLLDAATILETLHPEIEFIFIGHEETQRRINLEKEQRSLGNVRVLPFQPHGRLRDIMESGDVHVISIKDNAAGLMVPAKFYAILAAARPVILVGPTSSEVGRVITDYGAGVVVPERAAQQLVQAIIDYRMREDLWFAAQDGAIKAAAAYSTDDMVRLWVRKVRDVTGL
jgi:glycosyltransferase involved in cell wall biosynthesis